MANDEMKQIWKVPEPTLRRLPWYLAFLKLMKGRGEAFVSSTQIAKEINVDPSQVAKDLSFVNISGKTRVGYEISTLVDVLEDFLGFTAQHKAFLFGVGSLGAALLQDSGLKQYGLEIVGGFDVRRELAGTEINGIPVYHMDDFPAKQKEYGATIGVITVPVDKAQEVTELIIAGGIKALWNFTPFRIRVPEDIVVHKAFLFGVGSLGAALLQDSGLKQYGLEIVGGFDVRRELAGTEINGIPVYHMDDFPAKQKEYGATIGVITVPVDKAQEVTELIIAGGIKALWNFTPFRIRVPEDIVVQNTSMYAHLAVMFNRLNSINH